MGTSAALTSPVVCPTPARLPSRLPPRCGVKDHGKTWTKKTLNNAATLYAKCCGTWICFHGPGNLMEHNSLGIVGWNRTERKNTKAQAIVFNTKYVSRVQTAHH